VSETLQEVQRIVESLDPDLLQRIANGEVALGIGPGEARERLLTEARADLLRERLLGRLRGHRQREIVVLEGMWTTRGMTTREISDLIDYDQANVYNTLRELERAAVVERASRDGGRNRWRLSSGVVEPNRSKT
jgi:hypothetical protein